MNKIMKGIFSAILLTMTTTFAAPMMVVSPVGLTAGAFASDNEMVLQIKIAADQSNVSNILPVDTQTHRIAKGPHYQNLTEFELFTKKTDIPVGSVIVTYTAALTGISIFPVTDSVPIPLINGLFSDTVQTKTMDNTICTLWASNDMMSNQPMILILCNKKHV